MIDQKSIKSILLTLGLFVFALLSCSARMKYAAPWISYSTANVSAYGVYHFRKAVEFEKVPTELVIHVSADNRYNLFVNEQRVCYGPAKGDLQTYKYDVIDIAPFLKKGKNQIAAIVYNGGKDKPLAFLSAQTAFFLKAENNTYNNINTDTTWKVLKNPAYKPISYNEMLFKERWFYGFYACGPGDEVDASLYPWGWQNPEFIDSSWKQAEQLHFNGGEPWNLVPRNIAFMDNHLVKPKAIRKVSGINFPSGPWEGSKNIQIPARTHAMILIDYETLTMGYPELTVTGGKGSSIKIKYAEALYEKVNLKAHRDSVRDVTMYGVWDVFHPDGNKRTFRPLWKRTFRYVQLLIETRDEPLHFLSHINEYSGYPYREMSTFASNDIRLNTIFEMGLHTLRMCSGETYYDTPFYEQLSYGGDNRPIGILSAYNTTDDRLFREVMRLYPQSVNKETGLFKSAYPSRFTFDMGSWSLAWIQSLYDYYLIRGDMEYIKQFLSEIENVLGFYERHLDENTGLIGSVKNQNFIDWSISRGSIPRSNEQHEMNQSVLLTLYFVHSLDCAIDMYKEIGELNKAASWESIAKRIKEAIYTNCWDAEKQLFKDYASKEIYSQHTNILAILCDIIPPPDQTNLLKRILRYENFDEMASSYFTFFLFKAMQKTGQEALLLDHLDFWYNFIDRGLTTCGETGFASHDRSDCHAWSAHPAYYLISSICGIKPADIGFHNVNISPHPGTLSRIEASMPHPKGRIYVKYEIDKGKFNAIIELPPSMGGTFSYQEEEYNLKEGINEISFKND